MSLRPASAACPPDAVEPELRAESAEVARTPAVLGNEGNPPMIYEVVIPTSIELSDPRIEVAPVLGGLIDEVTDQLALIDENTPALLDYAVSSDASDASAVYELTVDAADEMEAIAGAVSWVRAAIHATGAATPSWSVARVGSVSAEPVTVPA